MTWPIPSAHQSNIRRFVYFFLNISASQDWAHCIDNCGTEWGICCGPSSKDDNCNRLKRSGDHSLYDKCANEYYKCAGKCPPYDGVTTKVTTDFDNDNEGAGNKPIVADDFIMIQSSLAVALNEEIHHSTVAIGKFVYLASGNDFLLHSACSQFITLSANNLIKPVMADASGPAQDYQCIENCDTGLDICCKIANTADNCILKYKQGDHTWYNNCNSAMYSCRSACPRADDKAPTVTMDIGNEGARLRDNPIKPVLDDTLITNQSSFAVALNEETFVANGTFAYYLVINPSVMMKMNDV